MKKGMLFIAAAGAAALALGGSKKSSKKKKSTSGGGADPDRGTPLPDVTGKTIDPAQLDPQIKRGVGTTNTKVARPLTAKDRDYAAKAANNIVAISGKAGKGLNDTEIYEIAKMIGKQMFPLERWPKNVSESISICDEVGGESSSTIDQIPMRNQVWCELVRIVDEVGNDYAPVI